MGILRLLQTPHLPTDQVVLHYGHGGLYRLLCLGLVQRAATLWWGWPQLSTRGLPRYNHGHGGLFFLISREPARRAVTL